MRKLGSRIIAACLTGFALGFVWYALRHPEACFPWGNGATYTIYILYAVVTVLLWIAPFSNRK